MQADPPSALFDAFVDAFNRRRPGLLVVPHGQGSASIPEGSPGFGTIDIQDDVSELTMHVGRFTHCHFELFAEDGDAASQRHATVSEAIEFIEAMLDDRLACYRSAGGGGGCFHVGVARSRLSRLLGPRYAYTWSGKIYDSRWNEVGPR